MQVHLHHKAINNAEAIAEKASWVSKPIGILELSLSDTLSNTQTERIVFCLAAGFVSTVKLLAIKWNLWFNISLLVLISHQKRGTFANKWCIEGHTHTTLGQSAKQDHTKLQSPPHTQQWHCIQLPVCQKWCIALCTIFSIMAQHSHPISHPTSRRRFGNLTKFSKKKMPFRDPVNCN